MSDFDAVFLALSLAVAAVFCGAYFRRVRHLPRARWTEDKRARVYGALFFGVMLPYNVYHVVLAIPEVVARLHHV